MRVIREIGNSELIWKQPKASKRYYELQAGEEVLATLSWQKAMGTLALAETAEGSWTFKRSGFMHPVVTVRKAGSDVPDAAIFEPSWSGKGILQLPAGRTLRWASTNFWHSEWAWQEFNGTPLIRFKNSYGLLKVEGHIEVEPAAWALPELALFLSLGWYLMLLMASDSSAATAGIVASTAAV